MTIIEDAKPLQLLPTGYVDVKLDAKLINPRGDFEFEFRYCKKLNFENIKMIFEIQAIPKSFTKENRLSVVNSIVGGLYHKRMIEKMHQICPDDFQAFEVTLINTEKSKEQFENHDFYVLNVLHQVDALDEERSVFRHWTFSDGTPTTDLKKARYHDDRWNGHLVARDRISRNTIWHPRLASEFAKYKDIAFYTDEELIARRLS